MAAADTDEVVNASLARYVQPKAACQKHFQHPDPRKISPHCRHDSRYRHWCLARAHVSCRMRPKI